MLARLSARAVPSPEYLSCASEVFSAALCLTTFFGALFGVLRNSHVRQKLELSAAGLDDSTFTDGVGYTGWEIENRSL